jgi:ADP-ribose pyrophosphatase YjhB (NUDIX family)
MNSTLFHNNLCMVAIAVLASAPLMRAEQSSTNPTYTVRKVQEYNAVLQDCLKRAKEVTASLDKEQIKQDVKEHGPVDQSNVRFALLQHPIMKLNREFDSVGVHLEETTGAHFAVDILTACYDEETDEFLGYAIIKRPSNMIALSGGFHEYGKRLAEVARQEALEEQNLEIPASTVRTVGIVDDPNRDPRQHIITVVHIAAAYGIPKPTKEAPEVFLVKTPEEFSAKGKTFAGHDRLFAMAFEAHQKYGADMFVDLKASRN